MKPPRYQLREFIVLRLLRGLSGDGARFLEIGYGAGDMLVTLARRGFSGDGFDFSAAAKVEASATLARNAITGVELVDSLDPERTYDLILFFEVIGYWPEPLDELRRLAARLRPGGRLMFSFTDAKAAGAAEARTGGMRTFAKREIVALVANAGLEVQAFCNYGFPLANWLKPLLDAYHRRGSGTGVEASGLGHRRHGFARLYGLVGGIGTVVIRAFCWLQLAFRDGERGTGYVVLARRAKF